MSRGRHGRGFHQIKKKKKSKRHQAAPIIQQSTDNQPVKSTTPVSAVSVKEERVVEAADQVEKPVIKPERSTAMMADLRMVAILAVIMLVVLIVLAQIMS
jgi:hypothetical protein